MWSKKQEKEDVLHRPVISSKSNKESQKIDSKVQNPEIQNNMTTNNSQMKIN